ncbi:MAG: ABC transporter permease [Deltaproteobacteria bacterium]|nr:ABC transporter permease [Deltaproteobacteria bacterium]
MTVAGPVIDEGGLIIKLAWRNIWRNLRRTLITLSAVSFGLASIIVFNGFTDGFHTQWIANYVRAYTGHIQIHGKGYRDDPDLSKAIDPAPILSILKAMPEVEYAATRIESEGLASTAENSAGVLIKGVDLVNENNITRISERVIKGSYLRPGGKGVLIGHRLAKKLNADIGDKIVLMTQAADGTLSAELFRVEGIFKIGAIDFDSSVALITKGDSGRFTAIGDKVTEIAVLLKRPEDVIPVTDALRQRLEPGGLEVFGWQELMPALTEMIELDDVFMYVILAIVLVVVAFGILNTMLMSIMERTRELGIMMALGTKPGRIVALVLTEAFFIGALGTATGVGLGIAGNALISIKGFDLSRWAGAMEFFAALNPVIYPEILLRSVTWASLTIFITAILSAIYPALKASRLKPVEAIHFV